MDKEFLNIQMVAYMKDNLKMIKEKVKESIYGLMAKNMTVIGKMIKNMVLEK